jgi:hypothetical protein
MNLCLMSAVGHGEATISHIGVEVATNEVTPKETSHVREELRDYARRVAGSNLKAASKDPSRGISTACIPETMFAPTPLVPSLQTPALSRGLVIERTRAQDNPNPTTSTTTNTSAKRVRLLTESSTNKNNKCSVCEKAKKCEPDCIFARWRKDDDKPELEGEAPRTNKEYQLAYLRRMFSKHETDIKRRYN